MSVRLRARSWWLSESCKQLFSTKPLISNPPQIKKHKNERNTAKHTSNSVCKPNRSANDGVTWSCLSKVRVSDDCRKEKNSWISYMPSRNFFSPLINLKRSILTLVSLLCIQRVILFGFIETTGFCGTIFKLERLSRERPPTRQTWLTAKCPKKQTLIQCFVHCDSITAVPWSYTINKGSIKLLQTK